MPSPSTCPTVMATRCPKTIRYAWSGVSGDPLTYEYNSGTARTIVADVQNVYLDYVTRTHAAPIIDISVPMVVYEEFTEKQLDSDGTSLTIDTPGGTADGDLLIAAVATDGNTTASLSSAGWNLIVIDERYNEVTFGVWWKLATASEPSNYVFTWDHGQEAYGWIMRFTGHDATTPINAWSVETTGSNVTNNPPSPAVTSTIANAMILRIAGFDDDDISINDPGLSGHTAITMQKSGSGSGTASGGAGYVVQPLMGDSGASTFTLTAQEQTVAVTIAIAPEP